MREILKNLISEYKIQVKPIKRLSTNYELHIGSMNVDIKTLNLLTEEFVARHFMKSKNVTQNCLKVKWQFL